MTLPPLEMHQWDKSLLLQDRNSSLTPRHTGIFSFSLIQRAIQKVWKMNVRQKGCSCLNPTSKSCKKMHLLFVTLFFLSQFQHTPYTIELPLRKLSVLRHARCQRRALLFRWAEEALAPLLFLIPFVSLLWFDDQYTPCSIKSALREI